MGQAILFRQLVTIATGAVYVAGSSAFIDTCTYSSQGSEKWFGSSNVIAQVTYTSTATVYVAGSSAASDTCTYSSTATIHVSGSSSKTKNVTYNSTTGTIYVNGSSTKNSITGQLVQCVTGFSNSGNSITVTWNTATTAGNLLVVFGVAAKAYLTYPAGWNASGIESISNLTSEDNLWRYNAPSETSVTFANAGGTSGGVAWVACEFSGVLTSSAEDKAVVSTGTATQ